jgi:hypothetical protein
MDLLEGGTLNELRHRTGGKIPLEETLRIFETVLDLLAKCHQAGLSIATSSVGTSSSPRRAT